jgi:hypothetical protein
MRILRSGVCALAVSFMVGPVSADERRPLILHAEISATGATLFVSGAYFGRAPEVKLAGVVLGGVTVNTSGTQLTANMPALPAGSYRLEVDRNNWWERGLAPARFVVTVGAVGRQGAKGEKGDRGEAGAAGVPGNVALAGKACPPGQPLRGFDANGGLVCGLYPPAPPVTCGNGALDAGEEFEPAPGPFATAPVGANSCKYDFSHVTQLFCNGACSVAGQRGCDQADADLLCKLKTGNPASVATTFTIELARDEAGFSCPGFGTPLSNLGGRGVTVSVFYSDSSLLPAHEGGNVVSDVVCTNP